MCDDQLEIQFLLKVESEQPIIWGEHLGKLMSNWII